jgi:hypothetical protein
MLKLATAFVACASATALATGSATAAPESDLCVGSKPGCLSTIQAAVDAAQNGDTIRIGPGTFAGGITIDTSVSLVGTSAVATVIRGGGPVITIGQLLGQNTRTVEISRVTITGGVNDSEPSPFATAGGGVWIPEGADGTAGATVTIADSVITGNRVSAGMALPVCGHLCAFASGGGIANAGTLTLVNTRVSDNVAGSTSLTSDAIGGGIRNHHQGTLVLRRSAVTDNLTSVIAPLGRFAEAGGLASDGELMIEDGVVSGNRADAASSVPSSFPSDVRQEAVGGGLRITPGASATITRTTISGNRVTATNLAGDAQAVAGGLDVDGTLTLVDSRVDRNSVFSSVPPESGFLAGAVFGGLEVSGTLSVLNSSISHNVLEAESKSGPANVGGGGLGSLSGDVTLVRTLVVGNDAHADGLGGLAVGGGLLSVDFGSGAPTLEVRDSVVTANRLSAAPGFQPQGGGIFSADLFSGTPFRFTLERTVVRGNEPDQCFGC